MLTRLLKYDLKYMIRNMSVFYILSAFFAVVTRLLSLPEQSFMVGLLGSISAGCMISMIVSVVINTMMRSWVRFRDFLYKDEAYLTHTLPVTKRQLYDSMFLRTLIFFVIGFAVCIAALFVTYYTPETWRAIREYIRAITTGMNMSPPFFVCIFLVIVFLELFNAIQCGFIGIILGHGRDGGRVGFSVLYGFLIYLAVQVAVLGMVFVYGFFDSSVMELFLTGTVRIDTGAFKTLAVLASVMYCLIISLMSILGKRLLSRGVNIE